MEDRHKTKDQLIWELALLRRRVTELEAAEVELQAMRETMQEKGRVLRNISATSPMGIVYTRDGRIRWANGEWRDMFRFGNEQEYLDQPTSIMYLSENEYRQVRGMLYKELSSVGMSEMEAVLKRQDRSVFDAHVRISFLDRRDPSKGTIATISDISAIIAAERQVTLEKAEWQTTFDTVPDLVAILEQDHTIVRANRAMSSRLGFTPQEMVGRKCYEVVHGLDGPPDFCPHVKAMRDRREHDMEVAEPRFGGTFLVSSTPYPSFNGGKRRGILVARDITDLKKAQEKVRESESNFRSFFEAMGDIVIVGAPDGRILYSNPATSRRLQYSPEELKAMHILDLHPWVVREEAETILDSMLKGERKSCPLPLQTKKGAHVPVETRVWYGKWSGLDCVFGLCKDLSQEQEVLQKFDRFFNNNPAPMAVSTVSGRRFTDVNDAFLNTLGFARQEVVGKTSAELGLFADPQQQRAVADEMQRDGKMSGVELKVRRRDGAVLNGLFFGEVIESQGQQYLLTIMLDITDRKRAEEALERSMAQLAAIFDSVSDAIVFADVERRIVMVNRAFTSIWGYQPEEVIGKSTQFLYADETDYAELGKKRYNVSVGGPLPALEMTYRRKDGSLFPAESVGSVVKDAEGSVLGFIGVHRDIAERKMIEESLRDSERMKSLVLDNTREIFASLDKDQRILWVNKAASETLNLSPEHFVGKHCYEVWHGRTDPCEPCPVRLAMETRVPQYVEDRTTPDGRHWSVRGYPVFDGEGNVEGATELVVDITDRKKLEAQLLQSRKMQALGTLAAGIAHDFNNMLQVILGYADLLVSRKRPGDPSYEELQHIIKTSTNAADLVQKIRILSGRADTQRVPLDLNKNLRGVAEVLKHTLPGTVKVFTQLSENLDIVNADPGLLNQMVMGLAINAGEAMPDGGTLRIETGNTELDDDFCRLHERMKPGPHVILSVSDTGRGMDKEMIARMFDPFFSTKERDYHKGTGLGLSVVHGIVTLHGGCITVESEVGKGTTFEIYLPSLVPKEAPRLVGETPDIPARHETVLLVEDEEAVRQLETTLLQTKGYRVLAVADGQEALEVYEREQANISLVILDIIMARMEGKDCMEGLLRINPSVKVLIATGVARDDLIDEVVAMGARGSLIKPFNNRDFLEKVRDILDSN